MDGLGVLGALSILAGLVLLVRLVMQREPIEQRLCACRDGGIGSLVDRSDPWCRRCGGAR